LLDRVATLSHHQSAQHSFKKKYAPCFPTAPTKTYLARKKKTYRRCEMALLSCTTFTPVERTTLPLEHDENREEYILALTNSKERCEEPEHDLNCRHERVPAYPSAFLQPSHSCQQTKTHRTIVWWHISYCMYFHSRTPVSGSSAFGPIRGSVLFPCLWVVITISASSRYV